MNKILVIGDKCIDEFIYGQVVRLAPEAPVPIFNPIYSKTNQGMAGNVLNNLKSLDVDCDLICNEEEILKSRYVDERTNQILMRVDKNDRVARIDQSILKQIKSNRLGTKQYSAIIISDYNKGFLSEKDIHFICKNNKNVFLDTKKILDTWCENASFIKINHVEYEHTKFSLSNLDLEEKLIITMSDKGCKYNNKMYPVKKVDIKDVSGAGDTFIAALVKNYIQTWEIEKSIIFAQECATLVVQKKGVTTI